MQCSLIQGLYMSQVANQAGAYPRFCSMKQLEVFVPPPFPRWDASPLHKLFSTHLCSVG